MKTLVYLERCAVRGGIEVFAERHVARLRSEGHEVDVLSDMPADFSQYDEVIVHKCTDVGTLERFPAAKTTYYVHDHEPICPRGYAYTPLKANCRRPGGVWPCIFCAPLCRSWKKALARVFSQSRRIKAMANFARIVVISEFMKSRLEENGLPEDRIVVEPPTIDFGQVSSARSGECRGVPADRKVDLLYVGQLVRGKGVHLLLAAMARMKSERTLDIVGTGNMEGELRAMTARLGLCDRVRFDGFRPDPQDWMRAAECIVVPSFWQEPYGLVAAEAVALGKSVVAFAVGGLPEACRGRATLVPPGDVDGLAQALEPVDGSGGETGHVSHAEART